jgi:hypothetical protein
MKKAHGKVTQLSSKIIQCRKTKLKKKQNKKQPEST